MLRCKSQLHLLQTTWPWTTHLVRFQYMLLLAFQLFLLLPLFIITIAPTNCHYYCDLTSMRRRSIVECKVFCYLSQNWASISRLHFRKNFSSCKDNCSCNQRWPFYIDEVKEAQENLFFPALNRNLSLG